MRRLPPLRLTRARAPHEVLQISHRGGSNGAEDYSSRNLGRIAALGAHLVEIDIRMTADGHLVVHHDAEFIVDARATRIEAHSMQELTELAQGRLPAAASVIHAARLAGLGVYVDIKDIAHSALSQLIELLVAEDMIDRAILASVDPKTVASCAAVAPEMPRAVMFRPLDTDPIELARTARADFVHPCWEYATRPDKSLAGPWLDNVRKHRLGVVCWHEERPDVLAELLALGVDGICTDDPALLAELAASADHQGVSRGC